MLLVKTICLIFGLSTLSAAQAEESMRGLSAAQSEKLTQEVVRGHERWEKRLDNVQGSVHHTLVRNLRTNLQAMPGGGGGTRARFWQKDKSYREDVIFDEVGGGRTEINIFTIPSYVKVDVPIDKPPTVFIRKPVTSIPPWMPNALDPLHLVLGLRGPLRPQLLAGDLKVVESARETGTNGTSLIVARLALTEQGAKKLGLPSAPREGWRKEFVWLDEAADYEIVKYDYVGYDATLGHETGQHTEVDLIREAGGEWVPKRTSILIKHSSQGVVFEGYEYKSEFESIGYGHVSDDIFNLDATQLPPETEVFDSVRGKDYKWADRRRQSTER